MKKLELLTTVVILFYTLTNSGYSQEKTGSQSGGQPSRYLVGLEEQMLLPVNIIGYVHKPGQYMVPFRTDLMSLIAFAGGFQEDAKIDEIRIIRSAADKDNTHQRTKAQVFSVDIKKYIEKGDLSQIPQLKPDDTIVVKGTAARTVNRVFEIIRNLTIVAQFGFYIAVIINQ